MEMLLKAKYGWSVRVYAPITSCCWWFCLQLQEHGWRGGGEGTERARNWISQLDVIISRWGWPVSRFSGLPDNKANLSILASWPPRWFPSSNIPPPFSCPCRGPAPPRRLGHNSSDGDMVTRSAIHFSVLLLCLCLLFSSARPEEHAARHLSPAWTGAPLGFRCSCRPEAAAAATVRTDCNITGNYQQHIYTAQSLAAAMTQTQSVLDGRWLKTSDHRLFHIVPPGASLFLIHIVPPEWLRAAAEQLLTETTQLYKQHVDHNHWRMDLIQKSIQ